MDLKAGSIPSALAFYFVFNGYEYDLSYEGLEVTLTVSKELGTTGLKIARKSGFDLDVPRMSNLRSYPPF